jgi:hypothetical protein
MLISRHIVFDKSSFPFASSDPPPDDLDSLFSTRTTVCPIAPAYPSPIAGTSELVIMRGPSAPPPPRATRGPDAPACATHSLNALALARAIRGPDVFVRATHSLGFTLHRAPLVYQRRHPAPAPEPSRAGSSVYHPVVVARDPRSTHLIVTHRAAGVTKHVDRLQLSAVVAPPSLSPVPTSVRSALADPH